jgi:hypothetical protein
MNYIHPLQRAVLYRSKRSYGYPIDIYKLQGSQTDPQTGVVTRMVSVTHVHRAVYFSGSQTRRALARKMAAGTEAARDFAASGAYDISVSTFIVDRQDAPNLPTLTQDDWIIHDNRKFQVVKIDGVANESWVILARELVGEVPQQVCDLKVVDWMTLSDTCNG